MSNQRDFERISITIPKNLLSKFRKFCEDNAVNMSGRIARLIEKDLEKNNVKL